MCGGNGLNFEVFSPVSGGSSVAEGKNPVTSGSGTRDSETWSVSHSESSLFRFLDPAFEFVSVAAGFG
jgi:hypothetical protein